MAALSAMVILEIPQVNIMTKMDLLSPKAKKEIEKYVHIIWFIIHFNQDLDDRLCFLFYLQVSGPGYVLNDGGQLCIFDKQEIQEINQGYMWFGKLQLQRLCLEALINSCCFFILKIVITIKNV